MTNEFDSILCLFSQIKFCGCVWGLYVLKIVIPINVSSLAYFQVN